MTTNEARNLNSILDTNLDFYEYLLARYLNDTTVDLRADYEAQWRDLRGFQYGGDRDLDNPAHINAIKSVIDTLTSMVAEQKVRPFFNGINGTFETKKAVKAIQQYFDILFDEQKVHDKVVDAFRCACIMGKAYLYVNPFTNEIRYEPAHNIAVLNSEMRYSTPSKMLLRYINFPADRLGDYGIEGYEGSSRLVTLRHYIDSKNHFQEIYIGNKLFKKFDYKPCKLPIVQLFYNSPVFGDHTTSVVEELEGIQTQLDIINDQISTAAQLSPANQTFVIEGSSLNPKDLTNKAGSVYGVKMPAGVNTPPVVSVAPRLFDPQWLELQQMYLKQAYEIVGVSQLSAQSRKPSGLDSGVALQTLQNIESDRFQVQVDRYIQAYVDLANIYIDVVDKDKDVLPDDINTTQIEWKDVVKQKRMFKVQYSAATALSKDPAEKLKQIMQLSQVGLIGPDKISGYLDMPDLEDAYKDASSVADGVRKCIERALTKDDYEVPDWVSYQQLAKQITIMENQLYASMGEDKRVNDKVFTSLQKLRKLEENLLETMEANGYVDTTATAPNEEAYKSESGIGVAPEATTTPTAIAETTAQNDSNETEQIAQTTV